MTTNHGKCTEHLSGTLNLLDSCILVAKSCYMTRELLYNSCFRYFWVIYFMSQCVTLILSSISKRLRLNKSKSINSPSADYILENMIFINLQGVATISAYILTHEKINVFKSNNLFYLW